MGNEIIIMTNIKTLNRLDVMNFMFTNFTLHQYDFIAFDKINDSLDLYIHKSIYAEMLLEYMDYVTTSNHFEHYSVFSLPNKITIFVSNINPTLLSMIFTSFTKIQQQILVITSCSDYTSLTMSNGEIDVIIQRELSRFNN